MLTLTEVLAIATGIAVLAGASTSFLVYRVQSRTSKVNIITGLLDNVAKLRDALAASILREEECQKRLDDNDTEFSRVWERLLRLEVARLSIAGKLSPASFESIRHVLDAIRDGVVLSVPSDAGRYVYVNTAFASALGMTVEQVVASRWQELIHPDDLAAMEVAEGDAWSSGGQIVNRFRHADGHYVSLRWHFTNYDEGAALSVVWFDRRTHDSNGDR